MLRYILRKKWSTTRQLTMALSSNFIKSVQVCPFFEQKRRRLITHTLMLKVLSSECRTQNPPYTSLLSPDLACVMPDGEPVPTTVATVGDPCTHEPLVNMDDRDRQRAVSF